MWALRLKDLGALEEIIGKKKDFFFCEEYLCSSYKYLNISQVVVIVDKHIKFCSLCHGCFEIVEVLIRCIEVAVVMLWTFYHTYKGWNQTFLVTAKHSK